MSLIHRQKKIMHPQPSMSTSSRQKSKVKNKKFHMEQKTENELKQNLGAVDWDPNQIQ